MSDFTPLTKLLPKMQKVEKKHERVYIQRSTMYTYILGPHLGIRMPNATALSACVLPIWAMQKLYDTQCCAWITDEGAFMDAPDTNIVRWFEMTEYKDAFECPCRVSMQKGTLPGANLWINYRVYSTGAQSLIVNDKYAKVFDDLGPIHFQVRDARSPLTAVSEYFKDTIMLMSPVLVGHKLDSIQCTLHAMEHYAVPERGASHA